MGTRSQVYLEEEGIYLYQHWEGADLQNVVKKALSKRERWDDTEYLARIIFSEMIKQDIDGSTGYGIGTKRHNDIEYLVTLSKNKVIVEQFFGKDMKVIWEGTFENFICS